MFIAADDLEFKAGRKVPVCKKTKFASKDITIIIGGGAAGLIAAETLRSGGYGGQVMIISRETYLPIDRPKLSKSLKIDAAKIGLRTENDFKKLDIDITLGVQVTAVDSSEKKVTLDNGCTLKYNRLIIATGGDVFLINLSLEYCLSPAIS